MHKFFEEFDFYLNEIKRIAAFIPLTKIHETSALLYTQLSFIFTT